MSFRLNPERENPEPSPRPRQPLTAAPRNKTITRMTTRTHRAAFASALLLAASVSLAADPKFKKITLSNEFFSEGANVGDFNKDGKPDYVAGQVWVEGPDFTKKHEYATPQKVDPHVYSKNFFAFTGDINQDGWTDIVILGFPGEESWWFENPKSKSADGEWKRHVARTGRNPTASRDGG